MRVDDDMISFFRISGLVFRHVQTGNEWFVSSGKAFQMPWRCGFSNTECEADSILVDALNSDFP